MPALVIRLALIFLVSAVTSGLLATYLMKWVRSRTQINRAYRAVYGIGILLAAYYIGAELGSSGFLAVFSAGLATALLDDDLCDCFLEYAEVSSEMLMLLAFLLFGVVLSGMINSVALVPILIFSLVVLAVARPIAIGVALRRAKISRGARLFIGWFGPRGLSSLLFGLLLVTEGLPAAESILAAAGVVVIISVLLHGISASPIVARYTRAVAQQTLPEEREGTAAVLYPAAPVEAPRITPEELADRLNASAGEPIPPPVVLDVRSRSSYEDEATSARVALELIRMGYTAAALEGGYNAWRARYPTEPKTAPGKG